MVDDLVALDQMRRLRNESARDWKITTGPGVIIYLSGCGCITSSQMIDNFVNFALVLICSMDTHAMGTSSFGSGGYSEIR